jgi:hypothetical protein
VNHRYKRREEVQTISKDNISSKIIAEKFPSLQKEKVIPSYRRLLRLQQTRSKKVFPKLYYSQYTEYTEQRNIDGCKRSNKSLIKANPLK